MDTLSYDASYATESKNTLANSLIEHKNKLQEYESQLVILQNENQSLRVNLNYYFIYRIK